MLNSFEGSGAPAGIAGYKVEDYIQIIRHYLDKRKLDKAERAVEDALQHFQYEAKLYALKAEILRKSGELDASLEMIEEAICISPLETQYTFDKALILSEMEEHDEAMRILSIIRPYLTGREMYLYHLCLSRVFESQNEYGQMFNSLEEALRFNPESEEALELMWSCVTMGRLHERSIRFHKKFLDKYPYSYLAWYNLGHAYSSLNMYELAIDTMEYSFLINEEFENGYMDCAEICQQVGMYQKAMEIYMEAYELFGPDAEFVDDLDYRVEEGRRAAFAEAYRLLYNRISTFISLPVDSLDRLALQGRLHEIGAMEGATGKACIPRTAAE